MFHGTGRALTSRRGRITRKLGLVGVSLAVLAATSVALAPAALPAHREDVPPEPVHVRYVPDVIDQFRAFPERGEALGWFLNGAPDPTVCKHWQGIARSHEPGAPYMFVTRSGNNTPACPGDEDDHWGNLAIVKMGSRDGNGERMRSNRLVHDTDTDDSLPRINDRIVKVIDFDGTPSPDGSFWPHYYHPGGVQLIDDVLVVPLETPGTSGLPDNLILFLDVSDPENPSILSRFEPGERSDWTAGLNAITPMPDGSYLMLITGQKGRVLRIFRSLPTEPDGTTDLRDEDLDWAEFDDVTESELEDILSVDWPSGGAPTGDAHQMLNFVREGGPNGDLYLVGARNSNSGGPFGADHIDLYRVIGLEEGTFRLDRVATRHLRAVGTPTHVSVGCCDIANFAAATGIYVSPSGELLFYATEHDNDGPGGSVKAGEWRHKHMVRSGSSTYDPTAQAGGPYTTTEGSSVSLTGSGEPPIMQAWLELFADDGFTERSVVIDYPDFDQDDFTDFRDLDGDPGDPDNFSDDPSSMRWFAPVGCTVRVNDDDYGDGDFPGKNTRTLPGQGTVVEFPDLDNVLNDDGSDEIDGEITSVTFFDNCADYYNADLSLDWDLDGDGSFETSGSMPDFSAASLDGPTVVDVRLRASHPTDGRAGFATTKVTVENAPPVIGAAGLFDPTGAEIGVDRPVVLAGVPVDLRAEFTDPGVADTQTATIDWGDGSVEDETSFDVFSDAAGGATGMIERSHRFAAPGLYDVTLTVTDDDGGVDDQSFAVEVLSAEQALQMVVDELDALIATSLVLGESRALINARDHLDGSQMGRASNGALDMLERGDLQAAITKIRQAIEALQQAETAGGRDLSDLKDLLGLAGYSLASESYDAAVAGADPANQGEQKRLDEMSDTLAHGGVLLGAGDQLGAIDAFAEVVRRAGCRC